MFRHCMPQPAACLRSMQGGRPLAPTPARAAAGSALFLDINRPATAGLTWSARATASRPSSSPTRACSKATRCLSASASAVRVAGPCVLTRDGAASTCRLNRAVWLLTSATQPGQAAPLPLLHVNTQQVCVQLT